MDEEYRKSRIVAAAAEEEVLKRAYLIRGSLGLMQMLPSETIMEGCSSNPDFQEDLRGLDHYVKADDQQEGLSTLSSDDTPTPERVFNGAGISKDIPRSLEINTMACLTSILTPSVFLIMELPAEIRVKVCQVVEEEKPETFWIDQEIADRYQILNCLLIFTHGNITIDSSEKGCCVLKDSPEVGDDYPSPAILQTCKHINEEGTPILYGQNNFTVLLPLEQRQNPRQGSAFFLRPLRWSTIACIDTMSFISSMPTIPFDHETFNRPRAIFSCKAAHLLSRFTLSDFKYSPNGPDDYVVLSMSNYVSTQVMRAELSAFQRELEDMMRPSEEYLAAMADDPAS